MKSLSIRLHDTFGCTLVGTALIQSLRHAFPSEKLRVYTKNPDLLEGLPEADDILDAMSHELDKYDVDVLNYLELYKPQEAKPLRHLYQHMLEIATKQLADKISKPLPKTFEPKIHLTKKELTEAKKISEQLSGKKPLIWLQTKTSTLLKDWEKEHWGELTLLLENDFSIIDLSKLQYTKRQAIAITKFCCAGITLDTFLLHGSKAVNARNTIVLLTSSHKEVVTYPGQVVLSEQSKNLTTQNIQQTILDLLSK